MSKTLQPIGDFIILKITTKESAIVLEAKQNSKRVESITVFSISDEVKGFEKGDEVAVSQHILGDITRVVHPFKDRKEEKDNELYITVMKENILGIFK